MFRLFLFGLLFFLLPFFGCKKPEMAALVAEKHIASGFSLHDVFMLNPINGFVCGGSRYEIGILGATKDGGQTWPADSLAEKQLFSIHFWDDSLGITVGYDGKIYLTKDGGSSWVFQQRPNYFLLRTARFLSANKIIIVGGDGYEEGNILLSYDGGETWQEQFFPMSLRDVSFFDEQKGFVCGYGVVLKTEDGGQTWVYTEAGGDDFHAIHAFSEKEVIVAGYDGSVRKTVNGGAKWEKLRRQNMPYSRRIHWLGMAVFDKNNIYLCGTDGRIWKTDFNGDEWMTLPTKTKETLRAMQLFGPHEGMAVGDKGVFLTWE